MNLVTIFNAFAMFLSLHVYSQFSLLFIVSQLLQQQDKIVDILSILAPQQPASAAHHSHSVHSQLFSPSPSATLPPTSIASPPDTFPLLLPDASSGQPSRPTPPMSDQSLAPPLRTTAPISGQSLAPPSRTTAPMPGQSLTPPSRPTAPMSGHSSTLTSSPHPSLSEFGQSFSDSPLSPHSGWSLPSYSRPAFQEKTLPSGEVIITELDEGLSQSLSKHPSRSLRSLPLFNRSTSAPVRSVSCSDDKATNLPAVTHEGISLESLSDEFDFGWTDDHDDDSNYFTSQSQGDLHKQWYDTSTLSSAHCSRDVTGSESETILSPRFSSSRRDASRSVSPRPSAKAIPPPPSFNTPHRLKTVEEVMHNNSGTDLASLRKLTTALARDAIFGREELSKKTLTGRNDTEQLDQQKVHYIKTLVRSRVPNKSSVEFEDSWKWCRGSLSKSCQTFRNSTKRKSFAID